MCDSPTVGVELEFLFTSLIRQKYILLGRSCVFSFIFSYDNPWFLNNVLLEDVPLGNSIANMG